MAPAHRYVVADPLTDFPLGEIPLGDVAYARLIGTPGTLTGSFPVANRRLGVLAQAVNDRPLSVYAYRGAEVWWGGIIWQAPIRPRDRSSGVEHVDIAAAEFTSLPEHRRMFTDQALLDVDRGEALAVLWDRMQAESSTAGALVDPGTPTVGGLPWSGYWPGSSATPWAEAMGQVANVDPPFEWTVDTWADPDGVRHRKLRVGTPFLGNTEATDDWRPELLVTPSRVVGVKEVGDHTGRPTHVMPRGASTAVDLGGSTVPITVGTLIDADAVKAGALRVDDVVDVDTEDRDRLFRAGEDRLAGRLRLPELSVTLPATSSFHPGQVGDLARVRYDTFLSPSGYVDTTQRVIGVTVEPAERGRPETLRFTFQDDGSDQ